MKQKDKNKVVLTEGRLSEIVRILCQNSRINKIAHLNDIIANFRGNFEGIAIFYYDSSKF